MVRTNTIDEEIRSIDSLDKSQIKERLLNFNGKFKFDFTPEYLEGLSLSELRHLLLAALDVCS